MTSTKRNTETLPAKPKNTPPRKTLATLAMPVSSSMWESSENSESIFTSSRPHPSAFHTPTLPTEPTCARKDAEREGSTSTYCIPLESFILVSKPLRFKARACYIPESMTNSSRAMDTLRNRLEPGLEGLRTEYVTYWQPASLLSRDKDHGSTYALLVLNQPIQNLNVLKLIWRKAFFRIAADGGANRLALAFQDPYLAADLEEIRLDVICGDLDSLSDEVRKESLRRGTKIVEEKDQDSTDFTKCINYLRQIIFPHHPWPSNILCLGGLGGRVDQGLSQLHHLYMEQNSPTYDTGRVYLLSTEAITFVLKRGSHSIQVRDINAPVLGKHIGILPLKEKSVITTKGLEWDVTEWITEMGGQISTSNHVRADVVYITTTADVLFTIDLNFPDGNDEDRD